MKKQTLLLGAAVAVLFSSAATACSSTPAITIWVGKESVAFYKKAAADFLATQEEGAFPYRISIIGADTGAAAGPMLNDNTACGDIITVAHDNIGKLSQKSLLAPIKDEALLTQIKNDNPAAFLDVIKNKLGAGKDAPEFTFGVPYISQALFLYYNTKYVTSEQVKTFEGLEAAAKAKGEDVKSYTVTGTDSFNLSFTNLAVRESDKRTTVKIYDGFKKANCFYQGNDSIAATRWLQESFAKDNGGQMPGSADFSILLQKEKVLSVIGGAWHFNAVKKSLGEENFGCALIPTFTLTEDHVKDLAVNSYDDYAPKAGDVYRGGTFADCKCFVINNAIAPEKLEYANTLLKYFSSKDVQNKSFVEAGNVPAYADFAKNIDSVAKGVDPALVNMAKAQTGMANYGIAQPFMSGILNTYFYSKGADALFKEALVNKDNKYGTTQSIREVLYSIQHIWMKGLAPAKDAIPATLPADITFDA